MPDERTSEPTFEEARAQFPVLERFAYLQAGSVGPLSRATLAAMVADEERWLREGRGSRARFERILALREDVRARIASLVGVEFVPGRPHGIDDGRLQHRPRRARPRARGRGRHDDGRALRAHRPSPHVAGARGRRRARSREHRRGRHAANAAARALARPLDDRTGASRARAQGAHRAPDPRRRRAVRGHDPGRRARARLLHDLRAEVAVRA